MKRTFLFGLTLLLYAGAASAQKYNQVNHFSMDTLKWEKMTDKVYRKFQYGSGMTVAYFKLYKGAFIPAHNHPNEQMTHILDGKVEVEMQGEKYIVTKGDVVFIPANVVHSFRALENTLDMDVFSPIRMDWITNTAGYFTAAPKKEANLEVVAELPTRPGNVAVSPKGEVFATLHPLVNPSLQLIKINPDKSYTPFPGKGWQRSSDMKATSNTFDTPLGIHIDSKNRVWVIDMGLNYGKTRLFAFDAATGKKVYENIFPESVAPKGSFVQDFAVDDKNGFVYLADISNPGILVLNVKTGKVVRIKQLPQLMSEDKDIVINGKVINFGGKPARIGVNPITLSADNETLYFGAMNGTKWYKLPAKLLRSGASAAEVEDAVTVDSPKPVSDGAVTASNGNHYFTNLNEHGVDVWNAELKLLEPLVRDIRIDWPDNLAISLDGYMYISANQLYKTPPFTGKGDEGKAPFYIYRVKLNE